MLDVFRQAKGRVHQCVVGVWMRHGGEEKGGGVLGHGGFDYHRDPLTIGAVAIRRAGAWYWVPGWAEGEAIR